LKKKPTVVSSSRFFFISIRFTTLNKLCKVLDCLPGDILDYQPDPEGAEMVEDIYSE
jgi:putative transcriptional regulator